MPLPDSFIGHLSELGYHPRSDKHSNALSLAIVHDLLERCPPLAAAARAGRIVYALNHDLRFATSTWNVDLALGPPALPIPPADAPISRGVPATAQIAIEVKSVMTEHRKAVKNRKRDFEAHHAHVHNYSKRAIAAGAMVINAATAFLSPLRPQRTIHGDRAAVARLVEHCVNEMRNVTEAGSASAPGLDAKCAVVVDVTNEPGSPARFVERSPAPQPGDPLHYDGFIQRLCSEYVTRFGASL